MGHGHILPTVTLNKTGVARWGGYGTKRRPRQSKSAKMKTLHIMVENVLAGPAFSILADPINPLLQKISGTEGNEITCIKMVYYYLLDSSIRCLDCSVVSIW
jgi:hypothetical protein